MDGAFTPVVPVAPEGTKQQPPAEKDEHEDSFGYGGFLDAVPLVAFQPLDVFEVLLNLESPRVATEHLSPGELTLGDVRQQEPWLLLCHVRAVVASDQPPVVAVVSNWRIR